MRSPLCFPFPISPGFPRRLFQVFEGKGSPPSGQGTGSSKPWVGSTRLCIKASALGFLDFATWPRGGRGPESVEAHPPGKGY